MTWKQHENANTYVLSRALNQLTKWRSEIFQKRKPTQSKSGPEGPLSHMLASAPGSSNAYPGFPPSIPNYMCWTTNNAFRSPNMTDCKELT